MVKTEELGHPCVECGKVPAFSFLGAPLCATCLPWNKGKEIAEEKEDGRQGD